MRLRGDVLDIKNGNLVGYTVPQHIRMNADFTAVDVFFRVRAICKESRMWSKTRRASRLLPSAANTWRPARWRISSCRASLLEKAQGALTISIEEESK